MHYIRILFLFVLLALVSCQTAKVTVQSPAPDWYVNPPVDTNQNLYASGLGYPRERAVQAALNSIAGKISVQVSSDIFIQDESIASNGQENYISSTRQNIQNKVDQITINNFSVKEAIELNHRFYVLVHVDKRVLAEDKKLRLADLNTRMKQLISESASEELIVRIKALRKVQEFVIEARSLAFIVKSLDIGADVKLYLDQLTKYESMYNKAMQSLEWYIDVDSESASFKKILADKLSGQGYRIASVRDLNNVNQVVLKVRSTIVDSMHSSRYYSKLMTDFSVESAERSFSNIHKECFGSSSLGADQALLNASYQMFPEAESIDILRFLGIE